MSKTAGKTRIQKMTISTLLRKGDLFLDKNEFVAAKDLYLQALNLLDKQEKPVYEESKTVLLALVDVCFLLEQFDQCIQYSQRYLTISKGLSSAMLDLRIGQAWYEKGNLKSSWTSLLKALIKGGEEVFVGEDSKYLDFVRGQQSL